MTHDPYFTISAAAVAAVIFCATIGTAINTTMHDVAARFQAITEIHQR